MIHEALVPSREPITDPKLTWLHDNIPEVFHGRDVMISFFFFTDGTV